MKKLSIVLIIIGVLVGISPIVGKLYTRWNENRMLEQWYNSVDAFDASELAQADPEESYGQLVTVFDDEEDSDNETIDNTTADLGNKNDVASSDAPKVKSKPSYTVLGIIEIEKIKIKYPILEGVSSSDLSKGIGHIPGTAGLGNKGNCVLAGHRNYTFGRFFNRLDEVEEGDIISITTKKAQFKYKVYDKLVVKPDDVSVIKGKKDETMLTLVTCTPIYKATHRLILHASLTESVLLEP